MIQEIGQAYDNHYVACEATDADYLLHYRERGCLVHVTSHGGADAWAEGNAFDLPRVRDLNERPSRLVYAFAIGGARFFRVRDDAGTRRAAAGEKIVRPRYTGRTTALWALVAGFTEIGEPLEDTVRREVMEEVGLRVKNLRFYKSQPWSFTDTLLVGFWCEVDGDPTITVDHSELKEARWFGRDEIPLERTGDRVSLTGEMIEQFRLHGIPE